VAVDMLARRRSGGSASHPAHVLHVIITAILEDLGISTPKKLISVTEPASDHAPA